MLFLGPRFVVTVRHGEGSPLHDVRLDLEAHPDLLGIGPSSVLYAVVDRIVDDYAEVIDRLALDADRIAAFDELLTGVLQANLAQLTVRDNQLEWQYGYPLILLVVLVICAGLHRVFKRSGWL